MSSSIAGMIGSILTQPIDTLQTLLKTKHENKSIKLICYEMVKHNGPASLMSGILIRMAKIIPNSMIV